MRWIDWVRRSYADRLHAYEREMSRLRRMLGESRRLRAELSRLEREIYGVRDSALPSRQKALLEAVILVRFRRVETEMLARENAIVASGHVVSAF